MRSLLDGITSALRIPQQQQQQSHDSTVVEGPATVSTHHSHEGLGVGDAALRLPDPVGLGGDLDFCRFSTDSPSDLPFRMLLMTQNIGGLDPSSVGKRGENVGNDGGEEAVSGRAALPNFARQHQQQVMVTEFLAEVRLLVYEASRREYAAHVRKRTANSGGCVLPSADDSAAAAVDAPPLLDVIVLHFQEIGGRRLNREFNAIFSESLRTLFPEAGWTSGLLMENGEDAERSTALGSTVFLSRRMCPISSMLSFRHRTFVSITDDPSTYGSSPTFLFHGGKFSGAGASRKGYLLMSLRFGTVVVNFLNLHLFHDTRNTDAAGVSPSPCALKRQEALLEAMAECLTFISPQDPLFLFGDFNTPLEACSLLPHLKEAHRMDIGLEGREIHAPDDFWDLFCNPHHMGTIKKFDVELRRLIDVVAQQSGVELAEFVFRFPPTYSRLPAENPPKALHVAASEVTEEARQRRAVGTDAKISPLLSRIMAMPARGYQRKRIPAWCDRVVWNPAGLELMTGRRTPSSVSLSSTASPISGGDAESFGRYAYRSFALTHTDHDGVALLF